MATFDLDALFSPAAMAEVREHPDRLAIMDDLARASLGEYAVADAAGRWMFRDLGRSSLYLACVILDSMAAGLTASELVSTAEASGVASRGRVIAFLRHAEAAGEIVVPPGEVTWTRRRLILRPAFIERFRRGNLIYARAAARLAPGLAPLAERLVEDAFFRSFVVWTGAASGVATRLVQPTRASEWLFLERDRGMSVLFRLMTSQPRPRERLLETAVVSRSSLSREFEISRAHVNRLLADAEARKLVSFPAHDRVDFSESLSEDVERMIAVTLQVSRAALLGAQAQMPAVQPVGQSGASGNPE